MRREIAAASAMSSTVKFPGPLLRRSRREASVMACRVAALLSSRREGAGASGTALPVRVVGMRLHYVHIYTLCKFLQKPDSQLPNSLVTAHPYADAAALGKVGEL